MKALALGNGQALVEEVADPKPHGEWVVVKIEASPICGSDKKAFLSEEKIRTSGHEGAGVVTATAGSSRVREGDRVILNPLSGCGHCRVCRSGNYILCPNKPPYFTHFAQYVLVQDFLLTPLPEDISFDVGAMACCALGPAFRSLKRMNVKAFDTVLITGLGPVGMGATAIAKFLGARVIAVESVEFRQNMARELGADVVLNPMDTDIQEQIRKARGKDPLLKALDASGNGSAERLCIDMMEPGGMVAFCGENHNTIEICPSDDFIRKSLTLMGSWHYNLTDFEDMYAILRHNPRVERLITDVYGFSRAQEAFEKFMKSDTCKVILRPWE